MHNFFKYFYEAHRNRMNRILYCLIFSIFSFTSAQVDSSAFNQFVEIHTSKANIFKEKIFLHTNKTTYFSGEKVWFKAYMVNDINNLPSYATTNLYINLYDSSYHLISSKLFFVENGSTYGEIEIPSNTSQKNIMVPKSAVLWTGKTSVVYLKKQGTEKATFEFRQITIGDGVGDNFEVLSGLQNGDEVVTKGSYTIDAAAQLEGKTSMMNQNTEPMKNMSGHDHSAMSSHTSSTFKVAGNCSMCKTRIEDALTGYDGLISSNWNQKSKIMKIVFNSEKLTEKQIHQAIAKVGHDTEKVKASKKSYNGLMDCCKYKRIQ